MIHQILRRALGLLIAVALILPSFIIDAQAQNNTIEKQRLGGQFPDDSTRFPQAPLAQPQQEEIQPLNTPLRPWARLVFESYRDGNYEIYAAYDDYSEQANLTKRNSTDVDPNLLRGGTKIVYASNRSGSFDIWSMNLDGSNQTRLTSASQDDRSPDWSPDGSKILFQSNRDGNWEIYVMNANGSGQTRLTHNPDPDITPSWSPDGQKIVWSSYQNGGYRIWEMNANGTGAVQLSQQAYSESPYFAPDGSQIAYDADTDGDGWQELWVMDANGANQIKLSPSTNGNAIDYLASGWGAKGKYITFTTVKYILYNNAWYWTEARLSYTGSVAFYDFNFSDVYTEDFRPNWQTIDILPPISALNPLPLQSPGPFTVSWSGADQGAAGIESYDVQVRDGTNGSWTDWQPTTTLTSAAYPGVGGHTYYFRERARDTFGNLEDWPPDFDAFTTVENLPPVTSIAPLPAVSTTNLNLTLIGMDPGGSGIRFYAVRYKVDNQNWVLWKDNIAGTSTSVLFTDAASAHLYTFQVKAVDYAGNQEDWHTNYNGETQTAVASFGLEGKIMDNAGNPVSGAIVQSSIAPFQNDPSGIDGRYRTLVTTGNNSITINWLKTGYGPLPDTDFIGLPAVAGRDIVLPPTDNVVANPGLEFSGPPDSSWQFGGNFPLQANDNIPHTGKTSIQFGETAEFLTQGSLSTPCSPYITSIYPVTEKDGNVDVFFTCGSYDGSGLYDLYYTRRDLSGNWSAPLLIAHQAKVPQTVLETADGTLHIVWTQYNDQNPQYNVIQFYARRLPSGEWSAPVQISSQGGPFKPCMTVDASGKVNLLWKSEYMVNPAAKIAIFLSQKDANGTWSTPLELSQGTTTDPTYGDPFYGTDTANTHYAIWSDYSLGLVYRYQIGSGAWSTPASILTGGRVLAIDAHIDAAGGVNILAQRTSGENISSFLFIHVKNNVKTSPLEIASVPYETQGLNATQDENGGLHLAWLQQNSANYEIDYAYKPAGENWSAVQTVTASPTGFYFQMLVDRVGNPIITWTQSFYGNEQIAYSRKLSNGWTQPLQVKLPWSFSWDQIILGLDSYGWCNFVWRDPIYAKLDFNRIWLFTGPTQVTSELSQPVTLTPTLTAPVLSFFYQLDPNVSLNKANFDVTVTDGGIASTIFSTIADTNGWEHRSFDMTPWIGHEITLSFNLVQAPNQAPAYALVDDVSIGSTSPDVWVSGSFSPAYPGAPFTMAIYYGNQGPAPANGVTLVVTLPDQFTFISADPAPASVNGQVLTWDIGDMAGRSGPFAIQLTADLDSAAVPLSTIEGSLQVQTTSSELETANNAFQTKLFVGMKVYLPRLMR